MRLDLSQLELTNRAFSDRPMTFCDPEPIRKLSAIVELVAIETGSRKAREHWQSAQLANLLKHAVARSSFWRQRVGTKKISDIELSSLPILTRRDVSEQVKSEGCLIIPGDPIQAHTHSTSGSTGVPVEFFATGMNVQYNEVRSIAQYFVEGRDFTCNRTRLKTGSKQHNKSGFTVEKKDTWLGSLGSFIRSGINKHIEYYHPNLKDLRKELERDAIGYLIAQPRILEMMFQVMDPTVLKRAGMIMCVALTEPVDPTLREVFQALDVPIRANYSCEEVGIIGAECEKFAGNYHIATSNVIVEVSNDDSIELGDKRLGRVLVTHLHSYGTPFIRYDIGDLGSLADRCACGHDGPTLSDVCGRSKHLLKHSDGRVSNFSVRSRELTNVTKFDEFRIRQIDTKTIVVEIGGREFLTPDEIAAFVNVIKARAGDDFDVQVRPVSKIDWGHSIKRLGFHSEVL